MAPVIDLHQVTKTYGNGKQPMGDCVMVEAGGLHIVLNALRTQVFQPSVFEQFGVGLSDYATVFVKSAQHFNAGFAPRADRILHVAVPGSANPDFASLRLPKASRPPLGQQSEPDGSWITVVGSVASPRQSFHRITFWRVRSASE